MKLVYKSNITAGLALAVLLVAASPVVATAEHGTGNDDSTASTSTQSETENHTPRVDASQNGGSSGSGHNTAALQTSDSENATDQRADDSLHHRAAQLLQEQRQNHKERTQTQRQDACTQHKTAIDDRFKTLGNGANRYLNGFDNIFTKVQAYQAKNQLDVPNYDTLVADATAKQAAAKAAVAALDAQSGVKIDCTVTDPAASVAAVKTAAKDARNALQAYRASLKALVRALLDAKKSTNTSTDSATTSEGN